MLLAIDTSTKMIGIAILGDEKIVGETCWESKFHHTVELSPAVDDLLRRSGTSLDDLDAIAVAIGPGSFTGLRIGLAFAKGLALSRSCSLVGIPTLDVVAKAQPVGPYRLAAVLEAGRNRLAVGWYQEFDGNWRRVGEYENLTVLELREKINKPTLVCGELTKESRRTLERRYKNVIIPPPAFCVRRPSILAMLAREKFQAGMVDDPATLAPIYLHHGTPIPE